MTDDVTTDEAALSVLHRLYDRDGKLTAETVVDEARDVTSPLHRRFEWDDAIAAHEHRLEQARGLIRLSVTKIEGQTVRAWVHVRSAGTYAPTGLVFATVDWRDEILDQFRRDAAAFEKKWRAHKVIGDAYRQWLNEQRE